MSYKLQNVDEEIKLLKDFLQDIDLRLEALKYGNWEENDELRKKEIKVLELIKSFVEGEIKALDLYLRAEAEKEK